MVDTPVFVAVLAGAFAAGFAVAGSRRLGAVQGICILLLVPWVIRLFLALPRLFFPDVSAWTVILDSLLLNLDRNNFAALVPFYWGALTSFFSFRSRVFLRADIIAADTFFLIMFSVKSASSLEAYRWPVLMIGLFAVVLFLQILALILSIPPEARLKRREGVLAGGFLFLLVLGGGALFIRPSQEKAVDKGGGLLEPKLFQFDFSQILGLKSEISMNDDLVLIVKKDSEDTHILLRRYTLSGYLPKQGFYRLEDPDEKVHPQRLPDARITLPAEENQSFRLTKQEYYLVNFDAAAFIGMNAPVEVVPYESWDASSFKSAFAVISQTSEAMPLELMDAVPEGLEELSAALGLDPEEYALYTEYGRDERIASYARDITQGLVGYWDKIQAIYEWLKYGDYRYSLKPGIAPDGDQLGYFLFQSRKGYCSYYAFSFALLLRSLGIPARVAAGFFLDPGSGAFDYYPVRADMAHAWVEVFYPGYGWIDYDPTSETLAEGEEFRFSQGTPRELFERLIREILNNHSRLTPKEGSAEDEASSKSLVRLGLRTLRFIIKHRGPILLILVILIFLIIRTGWFWMVVLSIKPRKKARFLWAHTLRRLRLAGFRRGFYDGNSGMDEAQWARALGSCFPGLYDFRQIRGAARFAPVFTAGDYRRFQERYQLFDREYRDLVSPLRRLLAWVLPPLALALPPGRKGPASGPGDGDAGGAGKRAVSARKKAGAAALLTLFTLAFFPGDRAGAQDTALEADSILELALEARDGENWERVVELYTQGSKLYPQDPRFPRALGNLYYNRQLFRLAWDEYRRAEKFLPEDEELLYRLSRTAGYLNEDALSASYLERLLLLNPDDREAIGSLGWMYYKIHRLAEGENLLTAAIERLGQDADFAMTLGTIYSDMFRYDAAKKWYLEAIAGAESLGDRQFQAVARYNLSILESRFYFFNLSFEQTSASLRALNRASGRLAQGELFMRRMELKQALAEYEAAYELDTSPLSKVNLAQIYQIGGRLEEARLYAEDCLQGRDLSWMLNYGIDSDRYRRDLHEILKDTYKGLEKAEGFNASSGLGERLRRLVRTVNYRFKAEVHRQLYSKYSLLAADAYRTFTKGEFTLEALLQYYKAFKAYPRRALNYLRQARVYEEPLIPPSSASYDLEEGTILKNRALMIKALEGFDPLWERDMIAEVYGELAQNGRKQERHDAAERLFALNRGGLRQRGIPLAAELDVEEGPGIEEAKLRQAIKAAGLEVVSGGDVPPRYRLTLRPGGPSMPEASRMVLCELYDGGRGITVFSREIPFDPKPSGRAAFSRALGDAVFSGF